MKLSRVRIRGLSLPDVDGLHVYGGIALLALAGALVTPALGLAVAGAGLLALGLLYSVATASAARRTTGRPELEALKTATPPAADEAA